jgi:DNA replication protein DnaC
MSIKAMTNIWDHSAQKGSKLLLLLAIADHADEYAFAWPGVKALAAKIRMSERHTKRLLGELEKAGELYIDRRDYHNRYIITVGLPQEDLIAALTVRLGYDRDAAVRIVEQLAPPEEDASAPHGDKMSPSDPPEQGDSPAQHGDSPAQHGDKLSEHGDTCVTQTIITPKEPSREPSCAQAPARPRARARDGPPAPNLDLDPNVAAFVSVWEAEIGGTINAYMRDEIADLVEACADINQWRQALRKAKQNTKYGNPLAYAKAVILNQNHTMAELQSVAQITQTPKFQEFLARMRTAHPTSRSGSAPPEPACPTCHDIGYISYDVPLEHELFGEVVPCPECQRGREIVRQRMQHRVKDFGIELADQTFARFDPRRDDNASLWRAYQAARSFAQTPRNALLLIGPFGTGKTHLCAAIANELLARGIATMFLTVPDLLDMMSANNFAAYDRVMNDVKRVRVLILDDLGVEQETGWKSEKVYQVLNHRYNTRQPLVISTNYAPNAFDPRIADRLLDHAWAYRAYIQGLTSYRRLPRGER